MLLTAMPLRRRLTGRMPPGPTPTTQPLVSAPPEDAQEVCAAIRARVSNVWGAGPAQQVRVLYGGSVKASNVARIMAKADVDGALVGGASLDPDEFVGIVRFRMHPAELAG